jgi:hypothetical protein
MAHLLVWNHGTGNDNATAWNLITRLFKNTKHAHCLVYPGFGSLEFQARGKRDEGWKNPSFAKVQASGYIHQAAAWLTADIASKAWKLSDFRVITFVGFSRGCILTWHQIDHLRQNGWNGKAKVLAFDPCYGPWQLLNPDPEIARAQQYASVVWEVVMLWEGDDGILPTYLHPNPTKRFFLPGAHGTAVNTNRTEYAPIYALGDMKCREFLGVAGSPDVPACLEKLNPKKRREVYAQCKIAQWEWKSMAGYYGFNYARRMTAKSAYQAYQLANNTDNWSKSGFFYNEEDYDALKAGWSDIARAMLPKSNVTPKVFETTFRQLAAQEKLVAKSVWLWGRYKFNYVIHKDNYAVLGKFKASDFG